jgi:hypothetical protein
MFLGGQSAARRTHAGAAQESASQRWIFEHQIRERDGSAGRCPGMSNELNDRCTKDKRTKPAARQENPAGPHARPELTDHDKTPGSGMLPEKDDPNAGPTG